MFLKGPFGGAEGLMYGGKCASQSRFGQPYSWKEIYRFSLLCFVFEGNFQVQAPGGWREGGLYLEGRFNGGFLRYEFGGLLFGGAQLFSEFYGIFTC